MTPENQMPDDVEVAKPQLYIENRTQLQKILKKVLGPLVRVRFSEVEGVSLATVVLQQGARKFGTLYDGDYVDYAEILTDVVQAVKKAVKDTGTLPAGVFGPGFALNQLPKPPHKVGARRGEVRRRMAARGP